MKRALSILGRSAAVVCLLGGSGCSLSNLKEANRRLKESNDRLIAENNRLEEELAASIRKGGAAPEEIDPPATQVQANLGKKDRDKADPWLLDEDVEVARTAQGIKLTVPDRVFFSLGQANLSSRGEQVLKKVAGLINRYPDQLVRVDGHTDDTPVRKVRHLYPTNWELSSARACTVVRYLVEKGVNARRIYPAGFSYYRPVARGGAKSQNRRVEITILNEQA